MTILDVHHRAQVCKRADLRPFYPANEVGRPLNALPTLVNYPGPYAFRNGGPGMVHNTYTKRLEEPNANERERAMGFPPNTTAAPHVTETQRRRLLGQAMDLFCLAFVLGMGIAYGRSCSTTPPSDLDHLGGGTKTVSAADSSTHSAAKSSTNAADRDVQVAADRDVQVATTDDPDPTSSPDTIDLPTTDHKPPPKWKFGEQLTTDERQQLDDVLAAHSDCFAYSMYDLGRHTTYRMKIDLLNEAPIFKPKHRLSTFEWDLVHQRSLELEAAGLIRRSESTFDAPTVMPAKKDSDGNYTEKRMCGDYRALNDQTTQDRHPMPLAEDIFDQMSGFPRLQYPRLASGLQPDRG